MFGRATTLEEILAAITDRLVSACAYDQSQVFLSLADDADLSMFPPKDIFVQLAPRGFTPRPFDVIGGGNELFTVDITLAVTLWVRLNLDAAFTDTAQLTHATLGQLAKWLNVLKALQMYYPVGDDDVSIFSEPMRSLKFDLQPRTPRNGWGKVPSWWTVTATLDLS